ncbi:hypothetical protein NC796_07035 [Aliifodinibius sp. S!AR15-10]|nr:hypothetical protein [Aliifodinibius sp. S!AR15-10]
MKIKRGEITMQEELEIITEEEKERFRDLYQKILQAIESNEEDNTNE